jgi:hypothetical protein
MITELILVSVANFALASPPCCPGDGVMMKSFTEQSIKKVTERSAEPVRPVANTLSQYDQHSDVDEVFKRYIDPATGDLRGTESYDGLVQPGTPTIAERRERLKYGNISYLLSYNDELEGFRYAAAYKGYEGDWNRMELKFVDEELLNAAQVVLRDPIIRSKRSFFKTGLDMVVAKGLTVYPDDEEFQILSLVSLDRIRDRYDPSKDYLIQRSDLGDAVQKFKERSKFPEVKRVADLVLANLRSDIESSSSDLIGKMSLVPAGVPGAKMAVNGNDGSDNILLAKKRMGAEMGIMSATEPKGLKGRKPVISVGIGLK